MTTVLKADFSRSAVRVSTALSTSENGWPSRPFQIASLLHMLECYAHSFYLMGGMLKSAIQQASATPVDIKVPEEIRQVVFTCLEGMEFYCTPVGFNLTLKGIERAREKVTPEDLTYAQLGVVLAELERRVDDELGSILFMHVPSERAGYYPVNYPAQGESEKLILLNRKTRQKFPKSIEDAEEAGKCLALGRYTACVFHLMRIMERGVQRLGKKLKVTIPVEEKDWGVISCSINGALKRLPNSTVTERKLHARYAKAAVYLDNVRESWRNPTMHPKETYTDEEAEDCFRFVKQYMEHLASIL